MMAYKSGERVLADALEVYGLNVGSGVAGQDLTTQAFMAYKTRGELQADRSHRKPMLVMRRRHRSEAQGLTRSDFESDLMLSGAKQTLLEVDQDWDMARATRHMYSLPLVQEVQEIPSKLFALKYTSKVINPFEGLPPAPVKFDQAWYHSDPVQRKKWRASLVSEWKSFEDNTVYKWVHRRKDKRRGRPIDMRWVLSYKVVGTGKPVKYKSRAVARGCLQSNKSGTSYYFGTVRHVTTRALFALAAEHGYHLHVTDIRTAFLSAPLKEEERVHLIPPPGMKELLQEMNLPGAEHCDDPNMLLLTVRSVYGLAIAPKSFGLFLQEKILSAGFVKCENSDDCLYKRYKKDSAGVTRFAAVSTTVDDLALVFESAKQMEEFKDHLRTRFGIKDLGEPDVYLGMEVSRDKEKKEIYLRHDTYLMNAFEKFKPWIVKAGMHTDKFPVMPYVVDSMDKIMDRSGAFETPAEKNKETVPYASLIGTILYHVILMEPHLSFVTNILCRYVQTHGRLHWHAALHLLCYMRGRVGHPFVIGRKTAARSVGNCLWAMTDAAFADNEDSRSTSGYIVYLYSTPIAWVSKKQRATALSTTDAEIRALTMCTKELSWIKRILTDLEIDVELPLDVFEDNSPTVCLARSTKSPNATTIKYMEVRARWCLEQERLGNIRLTHVRTDLQSADILTKAVGPTLFEPLVKMLYSPLPKEELRSSVDSDLKGK